MQPTPPNVRSKYCNNVYAAVRNYLGGGHVEISDEYK